MHILSFLELFYQFFSPLLHLLITRNLPAILVLIAFLTLHIFYLLPSSFARSSSSRSSEPTDYLDDLPQQDVDDDDVAQQDDDLSSCLRREDWLNGVSRNGFGPSSYDAADKSSQEAEEAVHHPSLHNGPAKVSGYRPESNKSQEAKEAVHHRSIDKGPAKVSEHRTESAASTADAELKPGKAGSPENSGLKPPISGNPRKLPPSFSMIKRSLARKPNKISIKVKPYDTSPGSRSSSSDDTSPGSGLSSSSEDKAASLGGEARVARRPKPAFLPSFKSISCYLDSKRSDLQRGLRLGR